jgi:hypothetical protein
VDQLRQGFPLDPAFPLDSSLRAGRFSADGFLVCSITNIHEAEFMLLSMQESARQHTPKQGWRDEAKPSVS